MIKIGQEEVINVLKENLGIEFTTTEIAKLLNKDFNASIKIAMRKLKKDPFIKINFRLLNLDEKIERFGHIVNSRISVYWLE